MCKMSNTPFVKTTLFPSLFSSIIFDEKTPEKLLDILKPDIHVKGGDYRKEDLPETKTVEKNGGEVKILSFVDNVSTTDIINKIIEVYKK